MEVASTPRVQHVSEERLDQFNSSQYQPHLDISKKPRLEVMAKYTSVSSSHQLEELLHENEWTLIDFWATW